MRSYAVTGSAGTVSTVVGQSRCASVAGSSTMPVHMAEVPRMPKVSPLQPGAVGSAETPKVKEKVTLGNAPQPRVQAAIGSAKAPDARGESGSAAAPDRPPQLGTIDESRITDISSRIAVFKKTDMGWALTLDQMTQTAEPKFGAEGVATAPRKTFFPGGLAQGFDRL